MPGIFHQPIDRRAFLKATALAGGGLLLPGCSTLFGGRAGDPARLHLALLSDTHIPGDRAPRDRGFNPWEHLHRITPDVLASQPQGVILCGDAAYHEGLPDDYREVRALLEPLAQAAPVTIALGNHDDRANFAAAFPNPPGLNQALADKHVVIIEHDVARFIVLDSLQYVNHSSGLLGHAQRDWLAATLPSLDDRPAVIFVHHTLGDGDADLLDAAALFDVIRPHWHVKAIFYGHSHAWNLGRRERVRLINLPALGYNFSAQEPIGWVSAAFDRRGVDLTLHAIDGNRADNGTTTRVTWR